MSVWRLWMMVAGLQAGWGGCGEIFIPGVWCGVGCLSLSWNCFKGRVGKEITHEHTIWVPTHYVCHEFRCRNVVLSDRCIDKPSPNLAKVWIGFGIGHCVEPMLRKSDHDYYFRLVITKVEDDTPNMVAQGQGWIGPFASCDLKR